MTNIQTHSPIVNSLQKVTKKDDFSSGKVTERKSPFNKITYERNAKVYKILAHPTRLEILNILKLKPHKVEELLEIIPISKANMSQHLALLRHADVVTTKKEGLYVVYYIADPRIIEPCAILRDIRMDPR